LNAYCPLGRTTPHAAAGDLSFEAWVAEWTDRATTEIGSWQGLKTSVKGRFNAFSGTGV
jgi:hypothetical protein